MLGIVKSVVVYGPQGSGKSMHAEEIKNFFGLKKIYDGMCLGSAPQLNTLILTNLTPDFRLLDPIGIKHFHIDDVLEKIKGARQ